MGPDFTKKTIDTLAKRAAYLCSNPDCRVSTVGPNSEAGEATIIGEAAHIYAARPEQARYNTQMVDQARSEISNAIWLCRNCHKQVDRDPFKFTAEILFLWRESHEEYVASNLGTKTDKVRYELIKHDLAKFKDCPPIIRRIVLDKPPGWEWSLSAALMRYLNAPLFRRLKDLRDGVCALQIEFIDDDVIISWTTRKIDEMAEMVSPLGNIVGRFNTAWGEPGQSGDVDEIYHTALLLRDSLAQIVRHEEQIASVRVSAQFEEVIELLKHCIGSQAEKFKRIPDRLDEIVEMARNLEEADDTTEPLVIHEVIEFDLPEGWADDLGRAISRAKKMAPVKFAVSDPSKGSPKGLGCVLWVFAALLLMMIFHVL